MFVYYFSGNLVFGLLLNMTIIHWVDRPIYAMINLKDDVRDAEESKYYRINKYLTLFKGQDFPASLRDNSVSHVIEEMPGQEEIQENLIDKSYSKDATRYDSGATDAASPRMATAATATRPTAFGSNPRATAGGSDAMRFSED